MKKSIFLSLTTLIFLALPIHSLLAENLLCATCGKGIVGSYQEFKGKRYCSETCLQDALPVCVVCGKPSPKYIRVTGDIEKIYCSQECLQTTLLKCEVCGKALKKQWVRVANHNYCSDCAGLPACSNCRLPGAQKRLADGRAICLRCIKTAILDEDHARRICQEVRNDIYTHLDLKTDHSIDFYLKDSAGVSALIGKRRASEEGFYGFDEKYRKRRGAKAVVSGTYSIYILSALPLPNFRNTVAHELAHDIGHTLYPSVQKPEDVEGFAEYISSLMNRYWGNEELNREKLQNREKAYADAYKKFLKIGEKNGLADVLDYMAKQNRKGQR